MYLCYHPLIDAHSSTSLLLLPLHTSSPLIYNLDQQSDIRVHNTRIVHSFKTSNDPTPRILSLLHRYSYHERMKTKITSGSREPLIPSPYERSSCWYSVENGDIYYMIVMVLRFLTEERIW